FDALVAAALTVGFEGTRQDVDHLAAGVGLLLAFRRQPTLEFVVEAFGAEVAFLVGDPFLQPPVRLDREFSHCGSPDCDDRSTIPDYRQIRTVRPPGTRPEFPRQIGAHAMAGGHFPSRPAASYFSTYRNIA